MSGKNFQLRSCDLQHNPMALLTVQDRMSWFEAVDACKAIDVPELSGAYQVVDKLDRMRLS